MMNAEERLDRENWYLTQELNRMPDPSLNPCEGIEQAYDRQRERIAELEAECDALLALSDVSRDELAHAICTAQERAEWGGEGREWCDDLAEGAVGYQVADTLLATWRVVRRQDGGKQ